MYLLNLVKRTQYGYMNFKISTVSVFIVLCPVYTFSFTSFRNVYTGGKEPNRLIYFFNFIMVVFSYFIFLHYFFYFDGADFMEIIVLSSRIRKYLKIWWFYGIICGRRAIKRKINTTFIGIKLDLYKMWYFSLYPSFIWYFK